MFMEIDRYNQTGDPPGAGVCIKKISLFLLHSDHTGLNTRLPATLMDSCIANGWMDR